MIKRNIFRASLLTLFVICALFTVAMLLFSDDFNDLPVIENMTVDLSVDKYFAPTGTADMREADRLKEIISAELLEASSEIDISSLRIRNNQSGMDLVSAAFSSVMYSDADLFYVLPEYSVMKSGWYIVGIVPRYRYSGDELDAVRTDFNSRVDSIVGLCDDGLTDLDKALFYHDYIIMNFDYDMTYSRYDAYGFLLDGTGVCQSYTLLYNELLDRSGINATYAKSSEMQHMWSVVEIDGDYYHVDVTWDDPVGNIRLSVGHSNFLLSDVGIAATGHNGWSCDRLCDDTVYDSAWWHDANSPIVYLDGAYYAVYGTGIEKTYDLAKDLHETVLELGRWRSFGGNGYYPMAFSGLGVHNGKLCFNDMYGIYTFDPETGKKDKIIVYDGGDGYIYGSVFGDDEVTFAVCVNPNGGGLVRIVTESLVPVGDVDLDGDVDEDDIDAIRRLLVDPDAIYDPAADIDGDGRITVLDLMAIRRIVGR